MRIRELKLVRSRSELETWPEEKFLIDTINAHSFVVAQKDFLFESALLEADALLPDGIGIVKACRRLKMENAPVERIAGADLFEYEMGKLEAKGGTCFFLGSSPEVLSLIKERAAKDYPRIRVETYAPPFKSSFSNRESEKMREAVKAANPDLLWVGMTAPKQEKWLYDNWNELDIHCHAGAIGAVFDFYSGTKKRAPEWWLKHNLEWLYRFVKEPRRNFRRYFVSGPIFLFLVLKELLDIGD